MLAPDVHNSYGTVRSLETRDRDVLAAMAVHELKEPVQAVQSFLSVVLEGRTGPLNEVQIDFLSTATQAARRISRRIEDFRLLFTDQPSFSLIRQELDLIEHLRSCKHETRMLADGHNVQLNIVRAGCEDISSTCWADPERLDQILLNLFENAIRYSSPGTTVNVFVRETACRNKAIVVQNTSDPGSLRSIDSWLTPFWREADHSRSVPTGMGLGLTIVDRLIRAHGGALQTFVRGQRVYVGLILPADSGRLRGSIPLRMNATAFSANEPVSIS